jgi:hypothetical protein
MGWMNIPDNDAQGQVQGVGMDNSRTVSFDIPVTTLIKPDDTIHKLAARSMIDDLESGCSHIHLGPNRPYPGSWEESNMVRIEAETIA